MRDKSGENFSASLKDRAAAMLLPTPLAVEREHPDRVIALKEAGATQINSRVNGEQRPNGIVDFMQFYDMLPTPTARDEKNPSSPDGARIARKQAQGWTVELNDMAAMRLLPTPLTRDYKGGTTAIRKDTGRVRTDALDSLVKYMDENGMLPTPRTSEQGNASKLNAKSVADHCCPNLENVMARVYQQTEEYAENAGQTSRLSPLFTQEMMGFPLGWTELPFLSESGAPKPSRPTETR